MPPRSPRPPLSLAEQATIRARLARGEHWPDWCTKSELCAAFARMEAQSTTWMLGLAKALSFSDQPEQHPITETTAPVVEGSHG